MSTVTYRYENNLTHFVKDVKHTIKENIIDGKEKGLSFFFLKKIGEDFYKVDVKEMENKKFKVEEKINEEVKSSEMSEAELLKMIKANKELKFIETYMKNRKGQKGGAKTKKGTKKGSKKSTKKGSKAKKGSKKSTKKGSKAKKGSKKSTKKGSKKSKARKSTKKGSRKGSKKVVKKSSKKSKRSTA